MLGAVMPWALLARPMHQVLSFLPYVDGIPDRR